MYDETEILATKTNKQQLTEVELPLTSKKLTIPSFSLFPPNQIWMYVSPTTPLNKQFQASDLQAVDLPQAPGNGSIKLKGTVVDKLKGLFKKANDEGYHLMISSGYRSIDEQQALYDDFVRAKGEALAKQYVASPGTSEHHTGLAVDVTDESLGCQKDADACNLSSDTASWLSDNVSEFGFIIRYPSGEQPVTGIAYEPWHLRFVGSPLAHQLKDSDLTFDEFIMQVAPGRVK